MQQLIMFNQYKYSIMIISCFNLDFFKYYTLFLYIYTSFIRYYTKYKKNIILVINPSRNVDKNLVD